MNKVDKKLRLKKLKAKQKNELKGIFTKKPNTCSERSCNIDYVGECGYCDEHCWCNI